VEACVIKAGDLPKTPLLNDKVNTLTFSKKLTESSFYLKQNQRNHSAKTTHLLLAIS
jgi:hypothetical protein